MAPVPETPQVTERLQVVSIDRLVPGPDHRRRGEGQSLDDLVASIREQGVLQPLLVRPKGDRLEVVAGRRRLAAAKRAKLAEVPVHVRVLTDTEAAEASITENLQREDVHPLDEADGYAALLQRTGRVEDVAARVGKSVPYVAARLSLTRLIPDARKAYEAGRLEFSGARALARLSEAGQRRVWGDLSFRTFADGRFGGRIDTERLEEEIRRDVLLALDGAPWPKADATLVPAAGPCTTCPKRTAAAPALFPDLVGKGDRCTDPVCFEGKMVAHIRRVLEADPKTLLLSVGVIRDIEERPWGDRKILKLRQFRTGDAVEVRANERCPHVVPGVVVTGERRGRRLQVCVTKTCDVHWKTLDRAEPTAQERARRRKEQLQREIEQRTLAAIAEAVRKEAAKHKEPDWLDPGDVRAMAMFVTMYAEQTFHQALAKLFGIEPDKKAESYALHDVLRKWVQQASIGDVTAFVLTATAAVDLLTLRWRGGQAQTTTRALAIRYGVQPDAIARQVTKEFAAKAKRQGRKRAAKAAAKPGARQAAAKGGKGR